MTCLPLQPDEGRQKARARCLQLSSPVRSSTSRVPRSCTGVNVLGPFAGQHRAGARLEAISLFCDAAHGHIADSPYLVNAYVHVRARRREGVICVFDSCTVNSPTTAAPLTSRGVNPSGVRPVDTTFNGIFQVETPAVRGGAKDCAHWCRSQTRFTSSASSTGTRC